MALLALSSCLRATSCRLGFSASGFAIATMRARILSRKKTSHREGLRRGASRGRLRAAMDSPRVRELVLTVFADARREWRYASDVIARAFREHREVGSRDRREVAERVYGMIRMHRRTDAICAWLLRPRKRTLTDLAPREQDLLRYLVYRADQEGAAVDLGRFGVDAAALARREQALRGELGLELSFPDWLVRRVCDEVADARELLSALNQRAPLCVRANTARVTREELAARLK